MASYDRFSLNYVRFSRWQSHRSCAAYTASHPHYPSSQGFPVLPNYRPGLSSYARLMNVPIHMPCLTGLRCPRQVIAYAVWAYHLLRLSTVDVEDPLVARGVVVSREAILILSCKHAGMPRQQRAFSKDWVPSLVNRGQSSPTNRAATSTRSRHWFRTLTNAPTKV